MMKCSRPTASSSVARTSAHFSTCITLCVRSRASASFFAARTENNVARSQSETDRGQAIYRPGLQRVDAAGCKRRVEEKQRRDRFKSFGDQLLIKMNDLTLRRSRLTARWIEARKHKA